MENVAAVLFEVESEAYQALAELKKDAVNDAFIISQAGLVQKKNGRLSFREGFDSGVDTMDDTAIGGLIGSIAGILGGPIGVLFTGSLGALIGSTVDISDSQKDISMLERVAGKMQEDCMMLVALVQETDEDVFDSRFSKFKAEILRWDAAAIAMEVEEAQKLEKEMQKLAKDRMRQQKKDERRQDWEQKRAKIQADFEAFRQKYKKA